MFSCFTPGHFWTHLHKLNQHLITFIPFAMRVDFKSLCKEVIVDFVLVSILIVLYL